MHAHNVCAEMTRMHADNRRTYILGGGRILRGNGHYGLLVTIIPLYRRLLVSACRVWVCVSVDTITALHNIVRRSWYTSLRRTAELRSGITASLLIKSQCLYLQDYHGSVTVPGLQESLAWAGSESLVGTYPGHWPLSLSPLSPAWADLDCTGTGRKMW